MRIDGMGKIDELVCRYITENKDIKQTFIDGINKIFGSSGRFMSDNETKKKVIKVTELIRDISKKNGVDKRYG